MPTPKTKLKIEHDGLFVIHTAKSRKANTWKPETVSWSALLSRFSTPKRTTETFAEYQTMAKSDRDALKDCGGFVGGALRDNKRKATHVQSRQAVCLDADHAGTDFIPAVSAALSCAWGLYSTHSHSPESPRYRLVIPLSRPVSADEYDAISRRLAGDLGLERFDETTFQPHRLMYWPSASIDSEFISQYNDAPWLDADSVLARYKNWRDAAQRPESDQAKDARRKATQEDPLQKPGIVGAFCRAYTIPAAIAAHLEGIYEPAGPGRYTYTKGSTAGGLIVYDGDTFAYSHHGTDPVSGLLVNAFDLVRIHKFGELDDAVHGNTLPQNMPSFKAMVKMAQSDEAVRLQAIQGAEGDFTDSDDSEVNWKVDLILDENFEITSCLQNFVTVIERDPALSGIAINEQRNGLDCLESAADVPWKRMRPGWSRSDEASLIEYIDKNYKIYNNQKLRDALVTVALRRSFHPIREYLNNLPDWDGVERLDKLLITYLGADDDAYVRAATRKTFTAAVARVMEPGCKFDYCLTLVGPQGIGKSTLFKRMSGERWFSDSLSLDDTHSTKTAAEKLAGNWICEISEMSGMKKADVEKVKSFVSSVSDKFRPAYGVGVVEHPRQCIIVGTSNHEQFLKDPTGNRRFWPVTVTGNSLKKPWDMERIEISQLWAEALTYYLLGEPLFLDPFIEAAAFDAQTNALETDSRTGIIEEYLSRMLPTSWSTMELPQRRSFLRNEEFYVDNPGTVERTRVCAAEVWHECLEGEKRYFTKMEAVNLNTILKSLPGWKKYAGNKNGNMKFPIYGQQRAYVRTQ